MSKTVELQGPKVEDQATVENEAVQEEGPKANALLISIELAQALVNYLAEKPLKEVEELVNAIRSSRPVTVNEEAEEPKS